MGNMPNSNDSNQNGTRSRSSKRVLDKIGNGLHLDQIIIADTVMRILYAKQGEELTVPAAIKQALTVLEKIGVVLPDFPTDVDKQKDYLNRIKVRVENLLIGLINRSISSHVIVEDKEKIEKIREEAKLTRNPIPEYVPFLQEQFQVITDAYKRIIEGMERYCFTGSCDSNLKIGAIETYCNYVLPNYINVFLKEQDEDYPHVEIKLLNGSSADLRNWMKYHDIDIAVTTRPYEYVGNLVYYKFTVREFPVYIAPKNYTMDGRDSLPFINLVQSTSWNDLIEKYKLMENSINTDKPVANGLQTIVNMVEQGLGRSVVPRTAVYKVMRNNKPTKKNILLNHLNNISHTPHEDKSFDIYLISRETPSKVEKDFINFLVTKNVIKITHINNDKENTSVENNNKKRPKQITKQQRTKIDKK